MKPTNQKRRPVKFEPPARFEAAPAPPVPNRGAMETELDRLKARALADCLQSPLTADAHRSVQQAANEAASVAWFTPYPLLVFPALFEEKARLARRRGHRQEWVRRRSHQLLAA